MRTHPVDKLLEQHWNKSAAGLLQLVCFYVCISSTLTRSFTDLIWTRILACSPRAIVILGLRSLALRLHSSPVSCWQKLPLSIHNWKHFIGSLSAVSSVEKVLQRYRTFESADNVDILPLNSPIQDQGIISLPQFLY